MLKDTKSLGNNKAPACESRGFVHKKRGVHFDTPPELTCIHNGHETKDYSSCSSKDSAYSISP
ncbi:hypothetical protein FNJ61_01895 [Bacteroides pyogenes]|nr:hypothetical protein FNJ61_01895 [Bacteroides pyogenes]